MKSKNTVSLSGSTKLALRTLGEIIKLGRLERKISQKDLAGRLNVSRYTVMSIEKGDPKVSIGVVFEAAAIVGVRLLGDNTDELKNLSTVVASFVSILPKRTGYKKELLDDDF